MAAYGTGSLGDGWMKMAKWRRREEKKRIRRRALILLSVMAGVVVLASVMYLMIDSKALADLSRFTEADKYSTVEIGGVRCRRRTRIKTYLFMGIDSKGKVGEYYEENGPGQSDVLQLVIIDQNEDTYRVLPINRDTITEVKSLEDDGTLIAASDVQIALAHANGDDREISCENTVDAVSHLLLDQPIDGYLTLNMDCIALINHMLGGITVTIEDDFSDSAPELKIGDTVKLTDEQAVHYIHDRMTVGQGTNEERMRRQKQYLDNAMPILREKLAADEGYAKEFYDALGDYMVTSLSGKDFSKLAKAFMSDEFLGEAQISGKSTLDYLGFKQFIADRDSLTDTVMELFYERV